MEWNEQLQKIRRDDKNNKDLFKREYMCEWVKEPFREELIKLLTDLYMDTPYVNHIIDYIRQDYYNKENQPYKPSMKNLLDNNLDAVCYQIIKFQDKEIRDLRYRLENEAIKRTVFYDEKFMK